MVLARLLTPGDFGLIAMVTSVTGFLRVFKDLGLSTATVQRENINHAQVCQSLLGQRGRQCRAPVWWLPALAPVVAWFYREPRLVSVTLALSVTFLFSGSAVQHVALLYRQMRFKAVAVIEVGSMTIGVASRIIAAAMFNLWLLGALRDFQCSPAMEASSLLFTWSISRWRPQWPVLRSGTRSMIGFGANLTVANFINCFSRNVDTMLLGRFFGAASVGIYSRALALLIRPLDQLLSPVTTVLEPMLARLQGEPERLRRTFLQIYNSMALVGFLVTGLLLALARPITLVLLGPQWEKAAVIFAGFSGLALYAPLSSALGFLLISQGRGRDLFVVSMVSNFFVIAGIIGGLYFGPAGVAIGWSVGGLLGAMPYTYYKLGRQGPVHTQDLWLVFLKHLPLWGIVIGTTFMALRIVGEMPPLLQLLICTPVGMLAGAIAIFSLSHTRQTAVQIIHVATDYLARRKF